MPYDFVCKSWDEIADALCNKKGERLLTPRQIMRRYGKEMEELKVTWPFKFVPGRPPNTCAWFSDLKQYFKAKGIGITEDEE